MERYKQKLYDFTPDYIFGRILLAIVIGITIATAVVFVKTAHAINTFPQPDYMVSEDMERYMQNEGHGQEFEEGDLQ
jgi:hypothetical protein